MFSNIDQSSMNDVKAHWRSVGYFGGLEQFEKGSFSYEDLPW